tara:strand:- start:176 stop:712 length:537 start_codon:yes stop_codon:yes gene_type:complete
MAYSQSPKSPLAKALKGNQHRLPEHLKAKIEAAPETPVKQTKSAKTAAKGAKAVDEGRDKKADRLYKRAARQENREIRKSERKSKKGKNPRRTIGRGKNFNKANKTGTGAAAGGGMTQKGVNEYKRKNPGSKLQTAVTTKPSKLDPDSKAAKRRRSFCARSKSWTSERGRAARRRWNC